MDKEKMALKTTIAQLNIQLGNTQMYVVQLEQKIIELMAELEKNKKVAAK